MTSEEWADNLWKALGCPDGPKNQAGYDVITDALNAYARQQVGAEQKKRCPCLQCSQHDAAAIRALKP